ncbi:MAG: YbaN family protein [Cohaesibacteraceae bacterium]
MASLVASRRFGKLDAKRIFWLLLGGLALALGGIGVVLPVLPTTPFVILAAFAFGKSSPRLQAWLQDSRVFGPIIADWRENGAIAPRYKATSLVMMGGVIILSLFMAVPAIVLIIQAVAVTGGAAFILTRPNG